MSNNYVLLETIELTANASSIVFDNIPQTGYTDLKVVFSTRTTLAGGPFYFDDLALRFNGDTGNNYSRINLRYRDGFGLTSGKTTSGQWIDYIQVMLPMQLQILLQLVNSMLEIIEFQALSL
jgi:hypothetical protein